MAKGYDAHQDRLAAISGFGKVLAKRAEFVCEWCGEKDDLRPYDLAPDQEPTEESLALLCSRCRGLPGARKVSDDDARALTGAVWHPIPLVAEGAARILARSPAEFAQEAIDGSGLDEAFKRSIGR